MDKIDTFTDKYNYTICPYCGDEMEQEEGSLTHKENETSTICCGKCEKDYVQTCIYISFARESEKLEVYYQDKITDLEKSLKRAKSHIFYLGDGDLDKVEKEAFVKRYEEMIAKYRDKLNNLDQ